MKINDKLLNIHITIFDSNIFDVVAKIDYHPCYVCERMIRGFLYREAHGIDSNKLALGHHSDDDVENILMGR